MGRLDTEIGNAGLLLFPLDGGAPRDVIAAMDRNIMPGATGYPGGLPQHGPDGTYAVCVRETGYSHLRTVRADGTDVREIVAGSSSVSGLSVVGGTAAIVLTTADALGEIALVDLGGDGTDLADSTVRTLTSHAPKDLPLVVAEERRFTISDGTAVTGWLRRDPQATGALPLLLDIHGGPHNAWNGAVDALHPYQQILLSRGWAVLTVNPRGSDGYGEAFFRGVVGHWGLADANDFLEPIDALVAEGIADPDRLAITGYSYGGYMTCYLTSRDDRFAAAVPGGVVTDLVSMGGTSDAGHFLAQAENGGMPWKDHARLWERSPYSQVDRVSMPTLVLHGAEDDRCPVGQAEQWFAALRERGVPSELVLYTGGSHLFPIAGAPSHRADFSTRIVDWVERHTAGGAPARPRLDAARWQRRLSVLAAKHGVPGAVLGILHVGEEPVIAHHGVLNVETGVETTDDALFQIGSITKVWTASVAMRLVDEGVLDLDTPVVEYLPDFRGPSDEITAGVTLRHLLSHTSGIDGDHVVDTGRGDDSLERFVATFRDTPQNHPLGATMSYCNAGYSLIGHLIEKVTGTTWDQAMRDLLFTPLGLAHTATLPEEVLLHRAAAGHTGVDDDGRPILTKQWMLPRSMAPAGVIAASAADVLAFARLHLDGGVAADGTRIHSEDAVARMRQAEIDMPDPYTLGSAWGLGWILFDWDGRRLIGHDGNTIGQAAFLRILPDEGLAVTLLTNGPGARALYLDLYTEIFAELAGLRVPGPYAIPDEPFAADLSRHLGTYERAGVRSEVYQEGGSLRLRVTLSGPLAEMLPDPVQEHELVPVRDNEYAIPTPGSDLTTPVVFYALDSGEPYVHMGVRASPKVV